MQIFLNPVIVSDTTDSSSPSTGSIGTAGGMGITKNLYLGGRLYAGGMDFALGTSDQISRGDSGLSRALVKHTGASLVINYGGDFIGGTRVDSMLKINNITDSTSTTTGALQVTGGAGIAGKLYVGGGFQPVNTAGMIVGYDVFNNFKFGAGATSTNDWHVDLSTGAPIFSVGNNGVVIVKTITDSTSVTTGAFQVAGGAGISKNLYVGGQIWVIGASNNFRLVSSGSSTYFQTGTTLVTGSTANLYFSGINGTPIYAQLGTNGLVVNSTTDSTSVTTGALQVVGGASISKTLYVGNLNIPDGRMIHFGYDVVGKESNAGKMGYAIFSSDFDIVGAGTSGTNRTVRIYDNLIIRGGFLNMVNGSLPMGFTTEVGGTTPLLNMEVNMRHTSTNTTYAGGMFRIDLRYPTGIDPKGGLFNWLTRNAGTPTETLVASMDSTGNLKLFTGNISHAGYGCFNFNSTTGSVNAGATSWLMWTVASVNYQTSKVYLNTSNLAVIYIVDPGMYTIHIVLNIDTPAATGSFTCILNEGINNVWVQCSGDEEYNAWVNSSAAHFHFMHYVANPNTQLAWQVINRTNTTVTFSSGNAFTQTGHSWSRLMITKSG